MNRFSGKKVLGFASAMVLYCGVFSLGYSQVAMMAYDDMATTSSVRGWKWGFSQEWDNINNSWGDTSEISVVSEDSDGQPLEAIIMAKSGNNITGKEIYTYENGKVKTANYYPYLPDSAKYSLVSPYKATFNWTTDGLFKDMQMEITAQYIFDLLGSVDNSIYETYNQLMPLLTDMKIISKSTAVIENGKVSSEINQQRVSGVSSTTLPLIASILVPMGFSTDTVFENSTKVIYSYGKDFINFIKYGWDEENNKWLENEKDSTAFISNKIQVTYSGIPDAGDYLSKDTYSYNSDGKIMEMTSYMVDGDKWVKTERSVLVYTPFSDPVKRGVTTAMAGFNVTKRVSENGICFDINISNSSKVSYQVTDMRGRIIEKSSSGSLSAGFNSVQLKTIIPGNYIFSIKSGNKIASVPFSVIR